MYPLVFELFDYSIDIRKKATDKKYKYLDFFSPDMVDIL